jgi:hypothetical protein
LFLRKFHGVKGLIEYLRSSYANIRLKEKNKETKGINGDDAEDIAKR